jgi:choice-of-anchor C domain-containing protein
MSTTRNSTPWRPAAALLASLAAVGAQAAPFQNGSFELGPTAPVNFCSACGAPYIGTFGAPYTGIPGWTVSAGSIDIIYLTGTTGWSPSDGSRAIDLDGLSGGTLVQTFDTVAGSAYNVSFDLAANFYAGDAIKSVLVTAPGFSQTYTFDARGRTALNMGWVTETFAFVATGGTTTLSFDSQTNSAFGAALDNVRVAGADTIPAIPEPATFALIGLGLAAGRLRLRRRA